MKIAKKIPIQRAVGGVTMVFRVTGLRRLRARLLVGSWLFRLGARVIGCDVRIEIEP